MADRWGPDPTSQMWERWRRPVLLLVAVVFVVNQWDRFTSGQPFVIVTGVGLAAFWFSVLFTRTTPEPELRGDADAWRANARRGLWVFGSRTVVAVGWLVVAGLLYSIRPLSLVVPAIPAVLLLAQRAKYRHADRMAEIHRHGTA